MRTCKLLEQVAPLNLDGLDVLEGDAILVLGGSGVTPRSGSGCGCGCSCSAGSGCGCGCEGGKGCGCSCATTRD